MNRIDAVLTDRKNSPKQVVMTGLRVGVVIMIVLLLGLSSTGVNADPAQQVPQDDGAPANVTIPSHPDPEHARSQEGQRTPESFQLFTLEVAPQCDLAPLSSRFVEMEAQHTLSGSPVRQGNTFTLAISRAESEQLRNAPCVIALTVGHLPSTRTQLGDDQSAPLPARVADIQNSRGRTPALTPSQGSSTANITGTVTAEDGGAALFDITVEAYRFNGSYWQYENNADTDGSGQFDIGGLPAGTYRLGYYDWTGAYVNEYFDDALDWDNAASIVLADGATSSGNDAALATAAHITGTVTAEDGGAPLIDIEVDAYRFNGSYWEYTNYAYTDGSGYFDIGGLPAGTYRIGYYDWSGQYLEEYFDNVSDVDSASDIIVAAAATSSGNAAALATAAHITGTVTAEDGGAPLVDIEVYAYRFNGSYWESVGDGYTDSNGQYDVGGLLAGTYRIGYYDWTGQYVQEYFNNAPNLDSATDIDVAAATTVSGFDAALAAAGHITGTVTAEDGGAGLVDIGVYAYRFNGSFWEDVNHAYTGGSGQFDIGGLPSGTYRIEYYDWTDTYVNEYFDDAPDLDSATDIVVVAGATSSGNNAALGTAAHITGTVTADDGGTPLVGISVDAYRFNGSYWESTNYYAYTDSNGQYDIGGLPAGTYRIEFYDWTDTYVNEYFDNAPDLDSATDIIVAAGATSSGNDAALATAAHITGTVTADDGGTPLVGISVDAYRFNGSYWESTNYYAYTDSNGYFDIGGLPPGTYRIGYYDWTGAYGNEYFDDAPGMDSATDIVVAAGATSSGNDAALATAAHITGTVTAEDGGMPLQDIQVTTYVYSAVYDYWESVTNDYTDENGQYDVGGLVAGTYRIRFRDWSNAYLSEYYDDQPNLESGTDIIVAAGATSSGNNASLATAAHITGTITAEDGGVPLVDINVNAYRFNGDYWEYARGAQSNASGQFDIGGLQAATYRLEFYDWAGNYLTEYYDNSPYVDSAADIVVAAGATSSGKDASLATAAHITGTITAEDGGTPLSDIDVYAYRFNGSFWESFGDGYTNANGQYDVGRLPAGTYRLEFYDWAGNYLTEYYDDAPDLDSATDIVVAAGANVSGYDAVLATAGHITGTVIADDGSAPLPDVDVTAYRYSGSYWESFGYGYTDANGQYDVGGLPAGEYRLRFEPWQSNHVAEYYDDAPDIDAGTSITIGGGATISNINASLATGATITGTVTAESGGQPLVDIEILAYRFNGSDWDYYGYAYTDLNGQYEVQRLASGTYRLAFDDYYEVYGREYYNDALSLFTADDIVVDSAGTVSGIDAVLSDAAHITGMVTDDQTGQPLEGIAVYAYVFDGIGWVHTNINVSTNSQGHYDLTPLSPGDYYIWFWDWNGNYLQEKYNDTPDFSTATPVSVTAGATAANINAALTPAVLPPFPDCVSNTGNDATLAVPSTVTVLGDVPLEPGDELALFTPDGTICAGHGVWDGNSLGITAWGDNDQTQEKDGFAPGEEMMFRLWDDSAGTLYDVIGVTYSQGNGLYNPNTFHVVASLEVVASVTQDIPLAAGWSMISSYVVPDTSALETVMAAVESDMVLMKNGDGQVYWPAFGINQIGGWDVTDGYQIYMTTPTTLSITGQTVDPAQTPITLASGWSMVGYLLPTPQSIDLALTSISNELYLAKNGLGEVYWPGFGINQIGDMQPGAGYQLYLTAPGMLQYPEN